MSDLERRSGSQPTRKQKEERAYRLVLASGALGVLFVVGTVLAIVTAFPTWIPVVAAILAVVCVILLRRTLSP
jgi:CHASE2 domain-containing sensor protein